MTFQERLFFAFLSIITICVLASCFHAAAQAPITTPWFSVISGGTTCRVSKVSSTPIRVSYTCFNQYGATAGSYTADVTNGGNGTNYFYIGLNSQALFQTTPTGQVVIPQVDTTLSCLIQMNGTAGPVMMLNGVTVPALSAAYSCSGFSSNGSGMISWP